jgi:hypothetical protein
LIQSPAWTARPPALVRILERLEIEHMRHASSYNYLFVSYDQFILHGVSKKTIRRALKLGEDLGLLEISYVQGAHGGIIRPPNQYRLTYVSRYNQAPPDNWRRVTPMTAKNALAAYKQKHRGGKPTFGRHKQAGAQFPATPAPVAKQTQKPASPVPQQRNHKTP